MLIKIAHRILHGRVRRSTRIYPESKSKFIFKPKKENWAYFAIKSSIKPRTITFECKSATKATKKKPMVKKVINARLKCPLSDVVIHLRMDSLRIQSPNANTHKHTVIFAK